MADPHLRFGRLREHEAFAQSSKTLNQDEAGTQCDLVERHRALWSFCRQGNTLVQCSMVDELLHPDGRRYDGHHVEMVEPTVGDLCLRSDI